MRPLVSRIGLSRAGIQFVWAATRVEGFGAATVKDAPRGCARRSTPACEPRAAALAVAPFARLELAREGRASAGTPGNPGSPLKKVDGLTFFSSGPVSRVQSRVVRQFFANRKMLINQSGLAHVTVRRNATFLPHLISGSLGGRMRARVRAQITTCMP